MFNSTPKLCGSCTNIIFILTVECDNIKDFFVFAGISKDFYRRMMKGTVVLAHWDCRNCTNAKSTLDDQVRT